MMVIKAIMPGSIWIYLVSCNKNRVVRRRPGNVYGTKSAIFLGGPRLCVFHARINLYKVKAKEICGAAIRNSPRDHRREGVDTEMKRCNYKQTDLSLQEQQNVGCQAYINIRWYNVKIVQILNCFDKHFQKLNILNFRRIIIARDNDAYSDRKKLDSLFVTQSEVPFLRKHSSLQHFKQLLNILNFGRNLTRFL